VHAEWVRYGDFSGFLARPGRAEAGLPGVVVIQEVWGVDEHIEDLTRRLAAAGYAALAPDLFADRGERPEPLSRHRIREVQAFMGRLPPAGWNDPAARAAALAELPDPERVRIEASQGALWAGLGQMDRFLPALRASVRHLRAECPASLGQKVACVGFCMGGGLSALLACEEPELAGAAIFYGNGAPPERVAHIQCPVVGFYGGLDARINAGLPAFAEAMRAHGKRFEYQVYEGAAHAFFNDTRSSYAVAAARDAYARLLEFLRVSTAT
jgi:carboxymethylenebutenolidase